jgi:hypothetical protein
MGLAVSALLSPVVAQAQMGPGPSLPNLDMLDDSADDYTASVKRQLSVLGDDRERVIAGVIDPTGYFRVLFDGIPAQVLDAYPLIGGQVENTGLDPADADRDLRTIRMDDRALIQAGGPHFQARDRLTITVSIGIRGRGLMKIIKADLSRVKTGDTPPPPAATPAK